MSKSRNANESRDDLERTISSYELLIEELQKNISDASWFLTEGFKRARFDVGTCDLMVSAAYLKDAEACLRRELRAPCEHCGQGTHTECAKRHAAGLSCV